MNRYANLGNALKGLLRIAQTGTVLAGVGVDWLRGDRKPTPQLLRTTFEKLGATLQEASEVLASLSEGDLLTTFEIQGYTVTGLAAVYQVVEHFALHYGQIVYVTKLLRGKDLGFYRELDATGRLPKR